ncbi:sigma-70 family RNA polymerase sigma factor [Blastopirellula sp. J2-11]|uniref:sigma-70 family RNA polymerase sigma factor n=1 Tax=Blastopirellula sp. J2-11 TaxID=2943192 RepID=UPI0021CA6272|nr:sigma-70 family RNA polymerase sigma factor [Blastopirellula sp. J2-11]UUO06439.1 sigma-70 family RNA polymerase sigma factor [Blastopirellula sp. J2-11]
MSEFYSSLGVKVTGLNREVDEFDKDLDARETNMRLDFEQLLQANRDKIMLYLTALVNNIADAEDLCQRISIVMWKKFVDYDHSRSFLSWACGVARLEAYNFRRARAADRLLARTDLQQLLAISLENFDQEAAEQRLAALRKCLQSLPELEQSFLRQIYWEGRSSDSIADELGCSTRTFYNRMYLLRRRLSKCVSRRLRTDS